VTASELENYLFCNFSKSLHNISRVHMYTSTHVHSKITPDIGTVHLVGVRIPAMSINTFVIDLMLSSAHSQCQLPLCS